MSQFSSLCDTVCLYVCVCVCVCCSRLLRAGESGFACALTDGRREGV